MNKKAEYQRTYRKANQERLKIYWSTFREVNKQRLAERQREYRKAKRQANRLAVAKKRVAVNLIFGRW